MSEQQSQRQVRQQAETEASELHPVKHDTGLDELLDEIDQILETTPDDYVRSFVQKGGQ